MKRTAVRAQEDHSPIRFAYVDAIPAALLQATWQTHSVLYPFPNVTAYHVTAQRLVAFVQTLRSLSATYIDTRVTEYGEWIDDEICAFTAYNVHRNAFLVLRRIALLFTDEPPRNLHIVLGDPELLSQVAFYDLSEACRGRRLSVTVNRTNSAVFQEFEVFLVTIYGLITDTLERFYGLKPVERSSHSAPPRRHRSLDAPA